MSLPGYAGGDRQKKKTQNVGREPEAFKGSWADFVDKVNVLVAYYHGRVVGGQWKASPNEVLRAKVSAGWLPILPDADALDMAFHKQKRVKVVRGVITTPRGKFHHPALATLPGGTDIDLAIPYRAADAPIAWIPGAGPVRLLPERIYDARDLEGARESGRRQTAANRAVKAMAIEAPPIDPGPIKERIVADLEPVVIAGRRHRIDHGATLTDLGQARQLVDQRPEVEAESQLSDDARRERALNRIAKGKTRAAA
jgi:hypothetical protein